MRRKSHLLHGNVLECATTSDATVAMVCVEVPCGDPLAADRQSMMNGDGDRIQLAEAHGPRLGELIENRSNHK